MIAKGAYDRVYDLLEFSSALLPPPPFDPANCETKSMGTGNMIVEFFSAAMEFNVCKKKKKKQQLITEKKMDTLKHKQ